MALFILNRDPNLRRAMGDLPPEALPAVTLETGIQSSASLQRQGVTTETRDYAPLVNEGSIFHTNRGDRVRVVSQITTPEGSFEVVTESIDIGLARPVAVGNTPQVQYYELTDAERELQAALTNAHNAGVLDAALNATVAQAEAWQAQQAAAAQSWADYYAAQQSYSAPAYTNESAPYTSVIPGNGGFVESAPVAPPAGSQGTEQLQENTVQKTALDLAREEEAAALWLWDGAQWFDLSNGGDAVPQV